MEVKIPEWIKETEFVEYDHLMFHMCFSILGQFIEDDLGPYDPIEYSGNEYRGYRRHFDSDKEPKLIDLWLWYRDELPKIEQDVEDDMIDYYSDANIEKREVVDTINGPWPIKRVKRELKYEYNYLPNLMDQKLRELIEIRQHLWT